jgi:histone chaperone ASF1
MSAVSITTINVLDNPAPFSNPLQFEIYYECLTDLENGVKSSYAQQGSRS